MAVLKRARSSFAELEWTPRYEYLALGAITLLAALLRFYRLGEWSFWLDEVYTIGRAQAHYSSLESTVRNIPPMRNWVPLSVILTAGTLNALGTSEWSARLVSATIGVLSIPVLHYPVRRLLSPSVSLVAALLLAVSPWHIYWSQNARFYTSLMLLYSIALFLFFLGLERDRPAYFLLSILVLYLAVSERLLALFIVPVVVFYLLLLRVLRFDKPPGFRVGNLVLVSMPAVAVGLWDLFTLVATGSSVLSDTLDVFGGDSIDDPIRLSILVLFNIGVPLVCLAMAGGLHLLRHKSRAGLLLVIGAVVPPLILAGLNPFVFTVDRFVLVSLPCWILLGAVSVHELYYLAPSRIKLVAAAVLLLLLADAAGQHLMYYQINDGNRLNWREAFRYVQEMKGEGDIVVSAVPELGIYYTGEEVLSLANIEPNTILTDNHRYWFIIDSQHSWWSGRQKVWVEQNCALLKFQYLRVRETFDLSIYLCDPDSRHVHLEGRPLFSAQLRPRLSVNAVGLELRKDGAE